MKKKLKTIVVLPAYNAEKTLEKTISAIPKHLYDELILVDDASDDNTYNIALSMGIKSFQNKLNLGYGGNLKVCFKKALEREADIIIEIHPDYEYQPSATKAALIEIEKGADLVLGNRFYNTFSALKNGMPITKYLFTRFLSAFHRLVFNVDISDFHQGFRVYTRKLLDKINYETNSNNYLFSFEVIAQAIFHNMMIGEVPVQCEYTGKKRGASNKNSFIYTLGTFKVLYYFFTSKLNL